MNKLIAKRDFRHGPKRLRAGDAFEASPLDTEYYMQYGFAEAAEGTNVEPASRRAYGRKDMQAEEMRTTALSPEAQNESAARGQAEAQREAQSLRKRAGRVAQAMTTQTAGALAQPVAQTPVAPANPDQATVPATTVPSTPMSTPENPTAPNAAPPVPVAPQPAPNVASGGGAVAGPTVVSSTGTVAGQASTNG